MSRIGPSVLSAHEFVRVVCSEEPVLTHMVTLPTYDRTQNGMFKCLPYFQILGVSKCGTTDLYNRLTEHPDMIDCSWKVGFSHERVLKPVTSK